MTDYPKDWNTHLEPIQSWAPWAFNLQWYTTLSFLYRGLFEAKAQKTAVRWWYPQCCNTNIYTPQVITSGTTNRGEWKTLTQWNLLKATYKSTLTLCIVKATCGTSIFNHESNPFKQCKGTRWFFPTSFSTPIFKCLWFKQNHSFHSHYVCPSDSKWHRRQCPDLTDLLRNLSMY